MNYDTLTIFSSKAVLYIDTKPAISFCYSHLYNRHTDKILLIVLTRQTLENSAYNSSCSFQFIMKMPKAKSLPNWPSSMFIHCPALNIQLAPERNTERSMRED